MSSRSLSASDRRTAQEDGADQLRVRLAAPPLSGVLRIVFVLVTTGLGLYLVWRLRGVIQLLAIALFFAFALFPVVDAIAIRTRDAQQLPEELAKLAGPLKDVTVGAAAFITQPSSLASHPADDRARPPGAPMTAQRGWGATTSPPV